MYISTICYAIVVLVVYILTQKGASCEHDDYTNTWAIQTDSEESAKRIARRYNFDYGGKIGSLDGYFLLVKKSMPRRRRRSTLYESRILSMDPAITWSQQQRVLKRVKRRFTDTLYKDQWYLENNVTKGYDINVVPVWKQGVTGRGVVVTILDDGIEYTHPDLKKNYDKKASYDYNDEDSDPAPRYTSRDVNKHGTRCAGEVAAAANNKVCGVGVAYNARIGGIRMLDGDVTDTVEARSLGHALKYIDIYSSSWGPEDKGVKVDGPGRLAKMALKDGISKGRAGKGSIFVWATGNGGDYNDYCNCDGYITSIYTISIGAVNDMGKSPWYAEPCPSTLAVTYSSGRKGDNYNKKIATTDLHKSCTKSHTGTSAAAPLAAGIFALVLEANPALTWRDLQHLIVETSRVTDDKDSDWHVNSAGYHVNNKYGFGLLDTKALVERAKNPAWETAPTQHACRGAEKIDSRKIQAEKIFRSTIFTDGCVHSRHEACVTKLEHVIVYVTLRHERRGTLEINLISPSGMKSKLLGLRKFDLSTKGFRRWPFMTVFHWGEKPRGTWTLEINNTEDFSGNFDRWSLKLYGTCAHEGNSTAHEKDVCTKFCKKDCPQEFATVCPNCAQLCDCTSGKCTKRCPRGLETDKRRNECTNSSSKKFTKGRGIQPEGTPPAQSQTPQRLPKYGQWLLVAAGVAVTLGIIAGIWQGWLYYKTRKKLNRARKQNQALRFPVEPRNTIVEDLEHARLTSGGLLRSDNC